MVVIIRLTKKNYIEYFLGTLNQKLKCKVYAHIDSPSEKKYILTYINNGKKLDLGFLRKHSYGLSIYRYKRFDGSLKRDKAFRMETKKDMDEQIKYLLQYIKENTN